MCGRYASARKRPELLEEFRVERDRVTESLPPDYNVAPTKPVYAVVARPEKPESGADGPGEAKSGEAKSGEAKSGEAQPSVGETSAAAPPDAGAVRELRVVRWGLVPFWAKDVSIDSRLIRSEEHTSELQS